MPLVISKMKNVYFQNLINNSGSRFSGVQIMYKENNWIYWNNWNNWI